MCSWTCITKKAFSFNISHQCQSRSIIHLSEFYGMFGNLIVSDQKCRAAEVQVSNLSKCVPVQSYANG